MDNTTSQNHSDLINGLQELALDLHWSWSHAADFIWKKLDGVLWEFTHNPLVILQTVSRDKISEVLDDVSVRQSIEAFIQDKRQAATTPAWFQQTYPHAPLTGVAYFSMEFMLSEALPIYSGGLGNVAGDHLKSASDLGVPIIGIGLLYQRGYSRQVINRDGTQQYLFPYNDPGQLPVTPLRKPNGEWLRIEVKLPGYSLWLRTWKVQVGRVTLLLLDSNDTANYPAHRGITSELYGGGAEIRLMQELVLGIGGWRLLKELNLKPEVCHLNEGHSAFAILERAADFMEENNLPFEVALTTTRSGNIFTTHTAVGAGFDCFTPALIEQYLGKYARERLRIPLHQLLSLGRQNAADTNECFNTSYLAINGSSHINGVSKLHSKVSRELFSPLFPRWPVAEVPVGYVTNGVHMPTWDSPEADKLWTEACGKDRWLGTLDNLEQRMQQISDEKLWELRTATREAFISYICKRYSRQLVMAGMPLQAIEEAKRVFDPNVLTIGFARRFVPYKRPNLLLYDPERLCRILNDAQRPVQLILAGKAHSLDKAGQELIKEWIQFIQKWDLHHRVIFLSDYDMLLTEHLVQGVDVWLNTPRKPWEACGTSGMKTLVNGGINISVLDGWWNEAYIPELGWAIDVESNSSRDIDQDTADAAQLYQILEQEVIPAFYNRNEKDIPVSWVSKMRASMSLLTPQFSANRSLREYTESYYLPAAQNYLHRSAKHGEAGIKILNWKEVFEKKWKKLQFGEMTVVTHEGVHCFNVQVYLNGFDLSEIKVELYAEALDREEVFKKEMSFDKQVQSDSAVAVYKVVVPAKRPISDFTPRILPKTEHIDIPLECSCILWQR